MFVERSKGGEQWSVGGVEKSLAGQLVVVAKLGPPRHPGEDLLLGRLRRPNRRERLVCARAGANLKCSRLRPSNGRVEARRAAGGARGDRRGAAVRPLSLPRVRHRGELARRRLGGLRGAVGCGRVLLVVLAHRIVEVGEPIGVVLAAVLAHAVRGGIALVAAGKAAEEQGGPRVLFVDGRGARRRRAPRRVEHRGRVAPGAAVTEAW
mmetsp:Transcript_45675/g.126788  ORF Transcript_45675/g.126788 Transcript_45675/m.126788 type:complete len:208 (+) Transcript_45675:1226-1849(+)